MTETRLSGHDIVIPPSIIAVDDEVSLSKYALDDADPTLDLVSAYRDDFALSMGWAKDFDSAEAVKTMKTSVDNMAAGKSASYKIIYKDTFVGSVNLFGREGDSAEMGYWIAKPFQGKGIVTRAATALRDFGFGEWGLHEISLGIKQTNEKSAKLAQRIGAVLIAQDPKKPTYNLWVATKHV